MRDTAKDKSTQQLSLCHDTRLPPCHHDPMNPPSPTDAFISLLRWIGVPSLILLPFSLTFFLMDWLNFIKKTREMVGNAADQTHRLWEHARQVPLFRAITHLLAQGTLLACTYSAFRLAHGMSIDNIQGRSIADGRTFTWHELWTNCTSYDTTSPLAVKALQFTAGYLIVINTAYALDLKALKSISNAACTALTVLAVLLGALIGLAGLPVLFLATFMHDPRYNIEMVSLYALWVIFLWGGAGALQLLLSTCQSVYGRLTTSAR